MQAPASHSTAAPPPPNPPSLTTEASEPAAVSPAAPGPSTVPLTAVPGSNSPVNLTCSVSGGGPPAPACGATTSFSPNPQTPSSVGATSTLTITTTGPHASTFVRGKILYAMWLPVVGMSLAGVGFGSARSRRQKLLGLLRIGMVMTALFAMPACGGGGGGRSGRGGGGPHARTY